VKQSKEAADAIARANDALASEQQASAAVERVTQAIATKEGELLDEQVRLASRGVDVAGSHDKPESRTYVRLQNELQDLLRQRTVLENALTEAEDQIGEEAISSDRAHDAILRATQEAFLRHYIQPLAALAEEALRAAGVLMSAGVYLSEIKGLRIPHPFNDAIWQVVDVNQLLAIIPPEERDPEVQALYNRIFVAAETHEKLAKAQKRIRQKRENECLMRERLKQQQQTIPAHQFPYANGKQIPVN
jgi:hypothetical protein